MLYSGSVSALSVTASITDLVTVIHHKHGFGSGSKRFVQPGQAQATHKIDAKFQRTKSVEVKPLPCLYVGEGRLQAQQNHWSPKRFNLERLLSSKGPYVLDIEVKGLRKPETAYHINNIFSECSHDVRTSHTKDLSIDIQV